MVSMAKADTLRAGAGAGKFGVHDPEAALSEFLSGVAKTRRILIGYSGGLDSHVLLRAAVHCVNTDRPDLELQALHVNHGMQAEARQWERHCQRTCDELGVALKILRTTVSVNPAEGPEASARIARYELFASVMRDGDFLLLAQHADDQAETFLLQALRGSGPDGLASIPRKRAFANGSLCRPLLGVNRLELEDYARSQGLHWVEDPSNQDSALQRNFLRNEIIPLLRAHWPSLNQTLSRSASRCGAASQLLMNLAAEDLGLVLYREQSLSVAARPAPGQALDISLLLSLGHERLFNVLRLWVRKAGYALPRLQDLQQVYKDLLTASPESAGIVNMRSYEFRRYRNLLHLLPPQTVSVPFRHEWTAPFADLHIPETGQTLSLADCTRQGLSLQSVSSVQVQSRNGGELIRIGEPTFHKSVKKLLQESQVPPWQRDSLPLLYIDGRLAAVWNVIVARDFQQPSVA